MINKYSILLLNEGFVFMSVSSWIKDKIATYLFLQLEAYFLSAKYFLLNINVILLGMKRYVITIRRIQDHVCLHLSKCAKVKITHLVIFTALEFLPPHHISCIWFWWNILRKRNYIQVLIHIDNIISFSSYLLYFCECL